MENYTLIFYNGDHINITVEDYTEACEKAEEYSYDYNTKLKWIWER